MARDSEGSAVLNERQIMNRLVNGDLVITPLLDPKRQIGPTSIDLRLGFDFDVFNTTKSTHLDPSNPKDEIRYEVDHYTTKVHTAPMERFVLHPGEFALASTLEYIKLPTDLAGRLEGRSTWGRLGLQIHSTAGFVDPGFEGILTYELQNFGKGPLCLYPGVRVAQMCFFTAQTTAIPYTKKLGAKYHGRLSSAGSLFYQDPEFDALRAYTQRRRDEALADEREQGRHALRLADRVTTE